MGPVAPCGIGVDDYWEAIVAGRSGIGPITFFDCSDFDAKVAGEVRAFDLSNFLNTKTPARRLARQTQLALAATQIAIEHARLTDHFERLRGDVPVFFGASSSSYGMVEQAAAQLIQKGPQRISPYSSTASQPHQAASMIAAEFGLSSAAQTFSSACPSGLDAIWAAAHHVRSGRSDVALAGGGDAPVCALGIACLQQSALVSRVRFPDGAIGGPFNRGNDSGIISEGAGMVVVEEYGHALERGATVYGEIVSCATRVDSDSDHINGGLLVAMARALADAGLKTDDIDYICAHASGHPALDRAEVGVIKKLFGTRAYQIPVSSIKGAVGNPLAAAGALQLIACALALRDGIIPPTANLHTPDPGCDLDHVPGRGRKHRADRILINAHGLGGGNSCMVFQRVEPPC